MDDALIVPIEVLGGRFYRTVTLIAADSHRCQVLDRTFRVLARGSSRTLKRTELVRAHRLNAECSR